MSKGFINQGPTVWENDKKKKKLDCKFHLLVYCEQNRIINTAIDTVWYELDYIIKRIGTARNSSFYNIQTMENVRGDSKHLSIILNYEFFSIKLEPFSHSYKTHKRDTQNYRCKLLEKIRKLGRKLLDQIILKQKWTFNFLL